MGLADGIDVERVRGWVIPAVSSRVDALPDDTPGLSGTPAERLNELFELAATRELRRIPGRETVAWPASSAVVVIKRYHGSDWRAWVRSRLAGESARSPARRECENLTALAQLGVRVPEPIAWCEDAGTARSAMVMTFVRHRENLRERLLHAPVDEQRDFARRVAEIAARLHAAGWCHRDLYLQHFVIEDRVDGIGELALLDVARAFETGLVQRRWFVKDVAALLHSAPSSVGWRIRMRCLAAYLDLRDIRTRGERRAFLRDVLAKQRRIAAHRPRFVDPRTARGAELGA